MSELPAKNLLLTGRPGCGKTTVVRRVIERLGGCRLAGFYTQEIRQRGRRAGFEAIGLCAGSVVLAHVDFRSRNRVGRYGVQLAPFDVLVRSELENRADDVDLFVIDEIGKMECYSEVFVSAAARVLDGPVPVLATIAARGGGFIAEVKTRGEIHLLCVSADNRDQLPAELAERVLRRSRIAKGQIGHP